MSTSFQPGNIGPGRLNSSARPASGTDGSPTLRSFSMKQ
jgi:hypothetical protein